MEEYWSFQDDFFNSNESEDEDDSTAYDEFRQKLFINPYYFENWRKSCSIPLVRGWPTKVFLDYMKNVLLFVPAPRSRKALENCKFSELQALEATAVFFVEAFILMSRRRAFRRPTMLIRGGVNYAKKFVKSKDMHEDYLHGVLYLYRWCLLNIYLRKGKIPPKAVPEDYNGQKEFDALPRLSKGLVFATKALFASGMQGENPSTARESIDAMREAARLDPKAYNWHYLLGNWLRCRRKREGLGKSSGPTEEELRVFWETYNVCAETTSESSGAHQMALAGIVQAVAELLRSRFHEKRTDFPVTIGSNMVYENEKEMVDFVLNNVAKMMQGESPHFAELIRCGEILANILPFQYRDYRAAEVCYKKAYKLMPFLSKINHKLGTLYFTSVELYDLENAKKYLKQAVKSEKNNFPAVMDLINVLLNSPGENREEIEALIQSRLREFKLTSNDKLQLCFSNGFLKFLTGEENEAILEWIKVFKLDPEAEIFKRVLATSKRYKWNIKFCEINAAIEKMQLEDAGMSEEDKEILKNISAILPNSQRQRHQYSRNNDTFETQTRKLLAGDLDNNWRSSSPPVTVTETFSVPSSQRRPSPLNNQSRNSNVSLPFNNQTPNKYVPPHKRNV